MTDLRGCRVKLHGLSTAALNGALGEVVGPQDVTSGRYPVMLDSPSDVASAWPNGVRVKEANLEVLPREGAQSKKKKPAEGSSSRSRSSQPQEAGFASMPNPGGWATGLSAHQQHEWLVDCYRMRVDDDYVLGGCNLHGLYDPDHTPDTILADFLVFCKLAVKAGVVPTAQGWDWDAFLRLAGRNIRFAFEKSDAQDKYGSENVFSALMGGRSLRATAEVVYGSPSMGEDTKAHRSLVKRISKVPEPITSDAGLFEDVGGVEAWERLEDTLQGVQ